MKKEIKRLNDSEELPITLCENRLALHERLAQGEIGDEKRKFEVHHSWDRVYVTFSDLKAASVSNIGIDLRDLVQRSYDLAVKNKLF